MSLLQFQSAICLPRGRLVILSRSPLSTALLSLNVRPITSRNIDLDVGEVVLEHLFRGLV